ncbi:dapper 1-B [Pimephales promelas]|uniref:dapper 1-B n=1 Tax=Pimephales promelas TaxID=90988 RepID=UPI0019555DBB|nr:dapper 1-B [Pimephales promelas]XP_039503583.1 dapper 1-B [Pimephales promelas]KAG1938739.1 dapper [Pimephales promelas]KAG1938740.1 dapper [Pimephales promelas]
MMEEHRRTQQRLEASFAWLCELEILKQRQESLVLGALSLGDSQPGCPVWGDVGPARSSREQEQLTLRLQLNRLQGAPSLLMLALQQQLSELRVDTGLVCEQNTDEDLETPSASSSGFYEQSESLSPPLRSCSSPNLTASCHRPRSLDAYMLDWEGHMEPTVHASLPRSFSAPYPLLEGIAEGIEDEEEEDEESPQWVTDQMGDGNESLTAEMSLTSDDQADPTVKIDDGPTEEDIQQAMRVETYILRLLQRRHFRSTAGLDSEPDRWQELHNYPPGYPQLPLDPSEWQEWAPLSEEGNDDETQDRYYMNLPSAQIGPTSLSSEEPESSLEIDQYGVKDVYDSSSDSPCHQPVYNKLRPTMKPHIHTCCNHTCVPTSSTPESREQHQPIPSQKWALLRSLTRRVPEEGWTTQGERQTKSTCRSRSEDSCASQGWAAQPEHKFHTVGRDIGRHHREEFYPSNQRLWCSTADLSQEEDEGIFREDVHELRGNHLPVKHTSVQFVEQDQVAPAPPNGSDSSLSETFSPGTSSVSSDSDESGGLVWPQQLPPRLPPSSSSSSAQNPSNAVVKIKASHALKKKIMRFRSGSLKLMTTV